MPTGSFVRRAASAYDNTSRHSKRAIVGGSAVGVNVLVALFYHHVLGIELSPEIASVIGGVRTGAVAWVYSGELYETIIRYYKFRAELRKVRHELDEE